MNKSSANSDPVTIRVPHDLLEIIDKKASALGGRRNRTETMLNLIRKALDLPIPTISQSIEKTEKLEQRLVSVESQLKELQKELVRIRQSNTKNDKGKKVESQEPLQLEISPNNKVEEGKTIGSGELMKILRVKAPHKKWKTFELRPYRMGEKSQKWHEFNSFKFKFKGVNPNSKNNKDKYLWLIVQN